MVFREVPDEITLAINISGCPVNCPGCHSSYLTQDIGEELNEESLAELIKKNPGITCVSFMGGDANPKYVGELADWVHSNTKLKVCLYSGRPLELNDRNIVNKLNFVKVGPYIDEFGPLDSPKTNQRFYKVEGAELIDWTYKFKKEN